MNYYYFDTSGIIGIFRKVQHEDYLGDIYWNISEEFSNGEARFGSPKNIIVSHLALSEAARIFLSKIKNTQDVIDAHKFFIEAESWIKIRINKKTLSSALQLMENHSELQSYDAIHLACALEVKNEHQNFNEIEDFEKLIFVTNDKILRKIAELAGLQVYKKTRSG